MKLDLIRAIRSQIQEGYSFTGTITPETERLAKLHDVTPFIYDLEQVRNKVLTIMARMIRLNHAAETMQAILEEACIDHIPMKGAVIRALYPQMWMRTSCDVDILIHEEDLDRATKAFVAHGYQMRKRNYHDVSLFSPDGVHLELHFSIRETIEAMDRVLDRVWDYAVPQEGCKYRYLESKEFFMFHHIAHMAYHFQGGGCGIRSFVDLWLMNKYYEIDEQIYHNLLREANLEIFEKHAKTLMHYWFDDGEANELILNMERYIVYGGVYGSNKQNVIIQQQKAGGRLQYFLERLFLPYETMVMIYPVLKKYKWLLPVCEIHRWGKVFSAKDRILKETKTAIKVREDYSVDMMKELGL